MHFATTLVAPLLLASTGVLCLTAEEAHELLPLLEDYVAAHNEVGARDLDKRGPCKNKYGDCHKCYDKYPACKWNSNKPSVASGLNWYVFPCRPKITPLA